MKKSLATAILFLFLFDSMLQAQSALNHTAVWYFNYNCGIDFNSGAPVSLNNSAMSTNEGCTSISDSNGNLLFYSDGSYVYNANHTVMSNGSGLYGGFSASQSCVAVPQPGSNSIWYLFTVAQESGPEGACYSVIDMSLQAGLGEVVNKNILLMTPAEEKITACAAANGTDFWVLYHQSWNNEFHAFPVTSSGVGTAVVSNAGSTTTGGNPWTGCMKFSPDGSNVAVAKYAMNSFEVFNFDNATGTVSYYFTVHLPTNFYAYGVEWSGDASRLYLGNVDYTPGQVYQLDMTQPDTTSILSSMTLVVNQGDILGTLQMAPDGRIYVNRNWVTWLGVINDPDLPGTACNYIQNGFNTAPHLNFLGLPNYITSWFKTSIPTSTNFYTSQPILCEKFCIDFFDSSTNNPNSWLWLFPGGSPASSTDQNPSQICYQSPGTYDVTLITTNASGADTLTISNYITVYPTPPFPTIVQNGNILTCSAATVYQWQFNGIDIPGATNQSYTANQTGYYTVIIGDSNGCMNSFTLFVEITGVEYLYSDQDISIYPNPSNGNFTIDLLHCSIAENVSLNVMNAVGQEVFSSVQNISSANARMEIELIDAIDGIYFIEIKTKNAFMRKKIIISN